MQKKLYNLIIISFMILPLTALAQEESSETTSSERERVSYSNDQIMLNNEAIEAVQTGNYSKAEVIFSAILSIQEINVTWYNLGRSYAKQGKCIEAYDAYNRVATAPILDDKDLTPELINEATQKAISDLDAQCSAKAIFHCDHEDILLTLDNGESFNCSKEPVPLVPGRHTVTATRHTEYGDIHDQATIELSANKIENIDVYLDLWHCDPAPPPFSKEHFQFWGWVMAGTGLALTSFGTGLLFADDIGGKRANNEIAASSLIAPGGAALIAGIAVLITNPPNPSIKNNKPDYGFCNRPCGCGPYEDWSEVEKEYRSWGWGLFGSGLALTAVGTGIWFADDINGSKDNNQIAFASMVSLGGLALTTGIIILIYDYYKFGRYSFYSGIQYQPEIFVSPQITGIGISGWF